MLNIVVTLRKMNVYAERLYDFYCERKFMDTVKANRNCIEELQAKYNTSECARDPNFKENFISDHKNVCFSFK